MRRDMKFPHQSCLGITEEEIERFLVSDEAKAILSNPDMDDNEYWKVKTMNIDNLIAWHDSDGSVGLEIEHNEAGVNQVWLTKEQWETLKGFGDEWFDKNA